MAQSGMYVLQGVVPSEVAAAPFDVKVVDIYADSGALFTPAEVALMGGGAGGGLLLGYFSIGEAETYRDYFKTIPSWIIGPENPQWAGNYQVAYWTAEWRAVATAYLDRVIAAGYDGIYFDVVDEYQQSWAQRNAPGGAAGAEQAMADLVAYLRNYAKAKVPTFQVWANNAEELLSNPTYFNAIDGMFKENLYYTDSGSKQPLAETQWSLDLMRSMIDSGKGVIAIEYVSDAAKVADVQLQAGNHGIGYYTAHIDLNGISYTGVITGSTGGTGNPVAPPPEDLILTGDSSNNILSGQAGNDKLYGKAGSDTLYGNAGNDWLEGGNGKDQLFGGAGVDTFVFRATGSKHFDAIHDFAPGVDKIALDRMIFSKLAAGGLAESAYFEGTRAQDATDRIIYNPATGVVYYDPDGAGGLKQVEVFSVVPGTDLSHNDFFVI
jgi:cysteinyl-tRNA synthetase